MKPKPAPTRPCPTCEGKGTTPIPDPLQQVLSILRLHGADGMTASEVWANSSDKIGITAVNNRFEALRELELVERLRDGKAWRYKLI